MNPYLQRIKQARPGDDMRTVLTADSVNAIRDAIAALWRGENIMTTPSIRKDSSMGMLRLTGASEAAPSTAAAADNKPWDIINIAGTGARNPTTGAYSSYKAKVNVGTVTGLLPSNIMEEFTFAATLIKWKCRMATDGRKITGSTLVVDAEDATPPTLIANALPASVDFIFGLTLNGVPYRTLGAGNPVVTYNAQIITDKTSTPPVGTSGVDRWYNILVS